MQSSVTNLYEACPLHPKQLLQVVCMDCEINALACPLCIDIAHKHHTMISLKKFIASELPKLYTKRPDHKILTKSITQLGSSYQICFEKMRKLVAFQINQLEKLYQNQIEALLQENNLVCGVGNHLYTILNVCLLKKKIKNSQKIPEMKAFTEKVHELCEKMEATISEASEQICEIVRGIGNFWQSTKELLLNSKRQFKFAFSNNLKHKSLIVEVNNWRGRKIINQLYDNSYHIGVIEPPLNPFKNQVQFRVDASHNKCVWVGVCNLKKIIDRRFSNSYKKGDGAYWLWQAGCEGGAQYFSHLMPDSQTIPWNFQVGDIVKVRVIFDQKGGRHVQFEKNNLKIHRAKIERAAVFCACVAMGGEGESVTILQN